MADVEMTIRERAQVLVDQFNNGELTAEDLNEMGFDCDGWSHDELEAYNMAMTILELP